MVLLPRFNGQKDFPLSLVTLADILVWDAEVQKDPRTLFHGVSWEGKVVRNCVQLGKLGWPYFEGIWKVWLFGGKFSLKVARGAHTVQGLPLCVMLETQAWISHSTHTSFTSIGCRGGHDKDAQN